MEVAEKPLFFIFNNVSATDSVFDYIALIAMIYIDYNRFTLDTHAQ